MKKNTNSKKSAAKKSNVVKGKFTKGCPKCGHIHADGRNRACRAVAACKLRRAA